MRRLLPLAVVVLASIAACGGGGGGDGDEPPGDAEVRLVTVASGLDVPLDVAAARSDASRLYVAEKTGRIRVIENGQLLATPFLDLSALVSNGQEQGLLGLVFHPSYPSDSRFFVNYTNAAGDTRLVSYRVSANPNVADPSSAVAILALDQPAANHNGGGLAFGPDGFLYVALGDGGGANDPSGNGQSLATLLGKLLRLDVSVAPYAVPATNPFVGVTAARGEIWAFGLRNPFRFSFDRSTGDLYVGDVGQAAREEIDFAPSSSNGGENYGWSRTEGTQCLLGGACDRSGITFPVVEYGHDDGCSVAGGYVYRGADVPALRGTYFYGDFCSGFVRSLRISGGNATDTREWPELAPDGQITSFGEDAAGELYLTVQDGRVLRIAPAE
ncbi:MAG: PQQ-dependent sugar dehydrogenase [Candidatus Binatia bacterium]